MFISCSFRRYGCRSSTHAMPGPRRRRSQTRRPDCHRGNSPRYPRRMHEWAAEFTVDEGLARRLIRGQFSELELGSVRALGQGWDMTVWLVDELWVFRFPRRETVIRGLLDEIALLPQLTSLLPLPIPVPTYIGRPSDEFHWPFYGAPFLPGRELADASLDDGERAALGQPLGEFLRALNSKNL